jgi:hypothetical protein
MTVDFLLETAEARRRWTTSLKCWKKELPRILHPAKLPTKWRQNKDIFQQRNGEEIISSRLGL